MGTKRAWLEQYSWNFVTAQNAVLCMQKNALHKPTSDGHDATKALWESQHATAMTLAEAVDLCRQCHRMAPFCFTTATPSRRSFVMSYPFWPLNSLKHRNRPSSSAVSPVTSSRVSARKKK